MAGGGLVAAYDDRRRSGMLVPVALLCYALAAAGLVGIVLWRLWTEVLAGVAL